MKYNIIFISNSGNIGGAQICLLNILSGLDSSLKPLVVIPIMGPFAKKLDEINIDYKIIPFRGWWYSSFRIKLLLRLLINIKAIFKLYSVIKNNDIKLIYSNTLYSPIGAFLAYFFKLKHIWHIHEFPHLNYIQRFDFGKIKSLKIVESMSNCIIVPSRVLKNDLSKYIKSEKIFININATKIGKPQLLNKYNNELRILVIGTIIGFKNQIDSIILVKELKKKNINVKLRLVGNGEKNYLSYLKKYINENCLEEEIEFHPHTDKPFIHYQWANLLINCSKFETFGMSIIEAWSFNVPVISYSNEGAKEIITNNVNGILYDNLNDLVSIVSNLFKSENRLQKLIKNGLTLVRNTYNFEHFSNTSNKLILKVLND